MRTKTGASTSLQVGFLANLKVGTFKSEGGFLVKNISQDNITYDFDSQELITILNSSEWVKTEENGAQ